MASSLSMDNPVQNLFFQAVTVAFENWTAFQVYTEIKQINLIWFEFLEFSIYLFKLAVKHGFGGKSTKEKADWFLNATYEWIVENENLDEYELQDFFEDTMDQEFNTQLEDSSAIILARLILGFYKMYKNGQMNELSADMAQRFPKKASNVENSKRQKSENQMEDDVNVIF